MRSRGARLLGATALSLLGAAACHRGGPAPAPSRTERELPRVSFRRGQLALSIELLDDDLVRLDVRVGGATPPAPLRPTPMVARRRFSGPSHFRRSGARGEILTTDELELAIDPDSLCVAVRRRQTDTLLSRLCPEPDRTDAASLAIAPAEGMNAYGLGQSFYRPGVADGDWVGRIRRPGGEHGNAMVPFDGGHVGDTQIPILYAVGPTGQSLGLFVDELAPQTWNFSGRPWRMHLPARRLRAYVMTGPDLVHVRSDYLDLTGHPPVPPKKMFGLWVSEYGFDGWHEIEDKLASLRAHGFPIDGFVLDLQWFGGITPGDDATRMGTLSWDLDRFPHPAQTIARLREKEAIGLMLIEESYVGRALDEHRRLAGAGYLVRRCSTCRPVYLAKNPWWGKGGMIDWTNPAAADFWHDWKRQPLVDLGVLGHWTDLGEPEQYAPGGWYYGLPRRGLHSDAALHNLYNFRWSESIARGYARHRDNRRPFILSRSGTAGSQRFGVALWSGDIAARMSSLAAHLGAQTHVWLSGIDFYGSDIGGFKREVARGDPGAAYTRWLAAGAAFDLPVRPHTENLCNCRETAPDRIGDLASNLANLRLRYRLIPYLYSLAHRAHRDGEAVFAPLVYRYPGDPSVRALGREKLVGPGLLIAAVTEEKSETTDVYLPAGTWANYHTREIVSSRGGWLRHVPLRVDGLFRLPMYMPAGAIVPQMHVDEKTRDATGRRSDGSVRDELVVTVVPSPEPTSFSLYEDDGETTAYLDGEVRVTEISQRRRGDRIEIEVAGARGTYRGAPSRRDTVARVYVGEREAAQVSVGGAKLPRLADRAALEDAGRGWIAEDGLILARSGRLDVSAPKKFELRLKPR